MITQGEGEGGDKTLKREIKKRGRTNEKNIDGEIKKKRIRQKDGGIVQSAPGMVQHGAIDDECRYGVL